MTMQLYRINDMRASDLHAQSLGNIPIRIEFGRIELVDPNPTVPAVDPDACDTPNFSLRTCDSTHAERLRSANHRTRRQADLLLELHLGRRKAAPYLSGSDDQLARAIAAFFGLFDHIEISAAALPPRTRDRNANPFLPTSGDPDFRRASGKYRRLRRLDTDPKLGSDASWFTSHHFAPRKETLK